MHAMCPKNPRWQSNPPWLRYTQLAAQRGPNTACSWRPGAYAIRTATRLAPPKKHSNYVDARLASDGVLWRSPDCCGKCTEAGLPKAPPAALGHAPPHDGDINDMATKRAESNLMGAECICVSGHNTPQRKLHTTSVGCDCQPPEAGHGTATVDDGALHSSSAHCNSGVGWGSPRCPHTYRDTPLEHRCQATRPSAWVGKGTVPWTSRAGKPSGRAKRQARPHKPKLCRSPRVWLAAVALWGKTHKISCTWRLSGANRMS